MWKFILFLLCSLSHKIEVLVSHEHITGVREAKTTHRLLLWLIVVREGHINLNQAAEQIFS